MASFSSAAVTGSGTRTMKLHWKTDSNPQVYVSGWELASDGHWNMVIYKTKWSVEAMCTNAFEIQHRFAVHSTSDRHYLQTSAYYNDMAGKKCDSTSCYGWWFSDLAVGDQALAVPLIAAIADNIHQTDYSEHRQHIWLFRNV